MAISKKKAHKYLSNLFRALLLVLFSALITKGQQYEILLKGGQVIDPRNNINSVMDVAIANGKIARVAEHIGENEAEKVINVEDLYVTPGLIDIHCHVFWGTKPNSNLSNGYTSVRPDAFTFRSGVTTVVDPGGAGWRNFETFKKQTIAYAETRVLALLNIVGSGMKGGVIEQNLGDMDPKLTAMKARQHEEIVGFKVAHYNGHDWTPIQRTVEAGELADMPVMIDFGIADEPLSLERLLMQELRPGDIFTHCYANFRNREHIVNDKNGHLYPFAKHAQERGVIFDVGHGGGSFGYGQAVPAIEQGVAPNTISTDLHAGSMNAGMKNQLNVMSKFLNLGLSMEKVVDASSWKAAQVIQREELGHLSEGAVADVAVLDINKGDFGFVDSYGFRKDGNQKLECELTLREGKVVWDLNGISIPYWEEY